MKFLFYNKENSTFGIYIKDTWHDSKKTIYQNQK